jgi:hypothetical protein
MTVDTWAPTRVALDRLAHCSQRDLGSAAWWACVAARLDGLRDELADSDILGLAAQVTADAPQYAAAARRLPEMSDAIQAEAAQLRLLIADRAGSVSAAPEVRAALEALLRRVRTLYRLSDSLLLDAYERDLGGDA